MKLDETKLSEMGNRNKEITCGRQNKEYGNGEWSGIK